jgi:hypothetical protein
LVAENEFNAVCAKGHWKNNLTKKDKALVPKGMKEIHPPLLAIFQVIQ